MSELRALLRAFVGRLWPSQGRPCPGCDNQIPRAIDVCGLCVERLPKPLRFQFRVAQVRRKRDHDGYRVALVRAGVWLAANPKRQDAATTTTTKETS